MDVAENGIAAGADVVEIEVVEDPAKNRLSLFIGDNGHGMPGETVKQVTDPFYTTRTTRRVGLGLAFLKEAAERCDGGFDLESSPGAGTRVRAWFALDHIDRMPLGDMTATITALIAANPHVDLVYAHIVGNESFELDTRELRNDLAPLEINDPAVLSRLGGIIRERLAALGGTAR